MMQEINLLPKKPFIQRYRLLIIMCMMLITASVLLYLIHLQQINDLETSRVESEIATLKQHIQSLENILESQQHELAFEDQFRMIKEIRSERMRWKLIIEVIYDQEKSSHPIVIQSVGWSGEDNINARVQFSDLMHLVTYTEQLVASEVFEDVKINQFSLYTTSGASNQIDFSEMSDDEIETSQSERGYNGTITMTMQSGDDQ